MHEISRCKGRAAGVGRERGYKGRHGALDAADTEALRRFAVLRARRLARGQFDPEDLAHEVLERWLRCAPRLAPVVDPQAWVTVVLRRLLVDRLRRRRAAAEVPAEGVVLAAAEPEPAPWWCDIELGAVRRELGRLPPALRQTFELYSFQARSYQQIAGELNIAMGTVGTRISRARALLRRRLGDRRAVLE
ncbi:MAG TPA: sigma-70 family RNA polymerase sigma factor [Kofleriaceae bacterium]|jgi:RNA polymerase sigma-70 factor (ECF subfamily)|nr:sigma-70 family RNA polymerase sigma factor [Kofleriaceae bacterium]